MSNTNKDKILLDGMLSPNGKFPIIGDGDVKGGYRTVSSINEMLAIPLASRKPGMLVNVDDGISTTFFKLDNNNVFKLFNIGDNSGNIPIYSTRDSVPSDFPADSSDEYLIVQETSPKYTEDEKYAMILETISTLFRDVAKIKNTMFSHMDLGNISDNSTLSRTLREYHDIDAIEPIEYGDTGESILDDEWQEIEEAEPEPDDYFKISHLSIKSGTEDEYLKHGSTLVPYELFWMTDKKRLYIKQEDGTVYWINRNLDGGDGGDPGPGPDLPDMDNIEYIGFIAPDKTKYKVTITNKGDLKILNKTQAADPDASQLVTSGTYEGMSRTLYLPKLYINSLYCGGLDTENPPKWQGCDHNFVELSNLTESDIYLNGLSLQYSINGAIWEVLPLEGIIKKGSTFLIRGGSCSVKNVNTTVINVPEPDMEWRNANNELIKFSNVKGKFCLIHGTKPIPVAMPYVQDTSTTGRAYCQLGYIDMVGLNKPGATPAEAIDGYEQKTLAQLAPNRLFVKYYAMDFVNQATKAIGARNNANDWTWIQLDANNHVNKESYTPQPSKANKDIFYNKSKLSDRPNLINVTFGIDAHKTRCFNWVSKGYYDEFIWIKKPGESDFTRYESFKDTDSRTKYTSKFYNRIRVVATDGTGYTAHKFIITDLAPGTYEYKVGRDGSESDIHRFKVNAKSTQPWKFVHTTDQQAFNREEYEVWRMSAEYIRKVHNPIFTINSGDTCQTGNRISEWLDYWRAGSTLYTGKDYPGLAEFSGVEQMNIIGNNDLCPEDFEVLGNGSDMSKMNSINFQFFFTYEMDTDNPPIITANGIDYFIPSLYSFNYNNTHFICVNSEIPSSAQEILFGGSDVYEFMRNWCEADLNKYSSYKAKIAVAHEMPFTIITNAMIRGFLDDPNFSRGGSRLNTETSNENTFWFSQMLERHCVQLCIGGHKHTYSLSHPLKENIKDGIKKTMQPIIQTTDPDFESKLTATEKRLCEVEVVSKITAPVYAMLQGTGYKLTSNKELPAPNIPWLKSYFPCTSDGTADKPNAGQQYPFFIEWTINDTQITGDVIKLDNIMTAGKFNVNQPNPNPIVPLNGNGSSNDKIIINL